MSEVKIKDARPELYVDLDAVILKPVKFRLHGNVHEIKPMATEDFFKVSQELVAIQELGKKELVTPDELAGRYHSLISTVCQTVTMEDIKRMDQVQCAGLLNLVIATVTGEAHADDFDLKKKILRTEMERAGFKLKTLPS